MFRPGKFKAKNPPMHILAKVTKEPKWKTSYDRYDRGESLQVPPSVSVSVSVSLCLCVSVSLCFCRRCLCLSVSVSLCVSLSISLSPSPSPSLSLFVSVSVCLCRCRYCCVCFSVSHYFNLLSHSLFLSLSFFSLLSLFVSYGVPAPYYDGCPEGIFIIMIQALIGFMMNAVLFGTVFARISRAQRRALSLAFAPKVCK